MIMKFYIPLYHPINLHGGDFGLITNLTKVKNYGKDRLNQSKTGVRRGVCALWRPLGCSKEGWIQRHSYTTKSGL